MCVFKTSRLSVENIIISGPEQAHLSGKGKAPLLTPTHMVGVIYSTPTVWLLFMDNSSVYILNLSID